MEFLTWGKSPWSQDILIHVSWTLLYVAAAAGVLFMAAHTVYVRMRPSPKPAIDAQAQQLAARIPERVARHSGAARAFHWVMAASMFTLLFTAFLPIVGVQFAWVTYHWIAGQPLGRVSEHELVTLLDGLAAIPELLHALNGHLPFLLLRRRRRW